MELLEDAVAQREALDDALRARLLARARQPDRVHRRRPAREPGRGGGRSSRGAPAIRVRSRPRSAPRASRRAGGERRGAPRPLRSKSRAPRRRGRRPRDRVGELHLARDRRDVRSGTGPSSTTPCATHGRLAEQSRSPLPEVQPHVRRERASPSSRAGTPTENGSPGEALAIARRTRDAASVSTVGVVLFPMLREQGRSAELEEPTRRIVDAQPRAARRGAPVSRKCSPTRTSSTKRRSRSRSLARRRLRRRRRRRAAHVHAVRTGRGRCAAARRRRWRSSCT